MDLVLEGFAVVRHIESVREASDIRRILIPRCQDDDWDLDSWSVFWIDHRGMDLGGSLERCAVVARERNDLRASASHTTGAGTASSAKAYLATPTHPYDRPMLDGFRRLLSDALYDGRDL